MSGDTSCKLPELHMFEYENIFIGIGITFPKGNRFPVQSHNRIYTYMYITNIYYLVKRLKLQVNFTKFDSQSSMQ